MFKYNGHLNSLATKSHKPLNSNFTSIISGDFVFTSHFVTFPGSILVQLVGPTKKKTVTENISINPYLRLGFIFC